MLKIQKSSQLIFQAIIQLERNITLVVISSGESEKEGWHYLAVKLSALLCKKTSNDCSDFYYLNFLHFFRMGINSNRMEKHVKIKTCRIEMPSEKK